VLRNVFLKTIRDRRRSLIGWVIGLVAFSVFVLGFYPTIRESGAELQRLLENIPPELRALTGRQGDLTSPAGFLDSQFFVLLAPLLLITFAIAFGARTLAGEEQQGTLELLLATPLPRWRIVLEKAAALGAAVFVLGLALWATLSLVGPPVGLDVGADRLALATLFAVLLAISFGILALAVGCLTGKRSVAVGTATVVAVAGYIVNAFAPFVDAIDTINGLSPFSYYQAGEALRGRADAGSVAFFVIVLVALVSVALAAFDRRDVRV
jgi:beta-exotoxin I transport system permease protein